VRYARSSVQLTDEGDFPFLAALLSSERMLDSAASFAAPQVWLIGLARTEYSIRRYVSRSSFSLSSISSDAYATFIYSNISKFSGQIRLNLDFLGSEILY
jgi:hypothetical protein